MINPVHLPVTTLEPIPIQANVSYLDARPGYSIAIEVLDLNVNPPGAVLGNVSASPIPCLGQATLNAICTVKTQPSSGNEKLDFKISPSILPRYSATGKLSLILTALLLNERGEAIPDSKLSLSFQILLTPTPLLFVKVPASVTVSVDGVTKPRGTIDGTSLTVGQHAISLPMIVDVDRENRLRFDHWSDGSTQPSRSVFLRSDVGLQAFYTTQHSLTVLTTFGNASGSGWYDTNSSTTFSVTETIPMNETLGIFGAKWAFQGWYEDGKIVTTSATGSIPMRQPHRLTASWRQDYTIPVLAGVLGLMVSGVSVYLVISRRKKRLK